MGFMGYCLKRAVYEIRVLPPQYHKEIKKKAQIYGKERMNTFIT